MNLNAKMKIKIKFAFKLKFKIKIIGSFTFNFESFANAMAQAIFVAISILSLLSSPKATQQTGEGSRARTWSLRCLAFPSLNFIYSSLNRIDLVSCGCTFSVVEQSAAEKVFHKIVITVYLLNFRLGN